MLKGLKAYDPRHHRTRLPGPLVVQIQTIDRCNAACIMCPYSTTTKSGGPPRRIDDELYARILEDMRGVHSTRSLQIMLQNEPLLDRQLAQRVRQAKIALGKAARVSIVTNGALLTSRRMDELLASGIDHISVSIDAYREETYRAIRKGLDFSQIRQNVQTVAQITKGKVTVRFLKQRTNEGEEEDFARFWKSHGANVHFHITTNRAGTLDEFERIRSKSSTLLHAFINGILNRLCPTCLLPFSWLGVLCDGRVILCCHDWGPRDVVGDLTKQSLAEVWNGEAVNYYRHLLWSRRTSKSLICKDCSFAEGFWNTEAGFRSIGFAKI